MSATTEQAINQFLSSCKVEGKPYGTIECYADKLKGFLWYEYRSASLFTILHSKSNRV